MPLGPASIRPTLFDGVREHGWLREMENPWGGYEDNSPRLGHGKILTVGTELGMRSDRWWRLNQLLVHFLTFIGFLDGQQEGGPSAGYLFGFTMDQEWR